MSPQPYYASLAEVEELIRGFEACTLPKEAWTHAAHLTVGAWYVSRFDQPSAEARLREGIRRYNESVGRVNSDTGGYHETLTLFWARFIRRHLDTMAGATWLEAVNALLAEHGRSSGLWRKYFSFDVVASTEARRTWIPPDLSPDGAIQ